MLQFIVLTSGHEMMPDAYQRKLDYFGSCLKEAGLNVIEAVKPYFGYDFTYLVSGKDTKLCRNTMEKFARARIETFVDVLTDGPAPAGVDKTFMIRLKY